MNPAVESREHHRRLLVALTLAVLAIVVGVGAGVDAHASTLAGQVAGTRVAVHEQVDRALVGAVDGVLAGEGRRTTTPDAGDATGSRVAPSTTRFAVNSAGETTMYVHRGRSVIEVSSHAARRMTQRGISIDAVEATLGHAPFQYFHQGVWKTGFYDPEARVFVGTVDDTVTTVIRSVSPNYIQNLQAAAP